MIARCEGSSWNAPVEGQERSAIANHVQIVAGPQARCLLHRSRSPTNKWAALVIAALAGGPQRHSELVRRIAGVSQKMLSQTLRTLERDGLLTRTVTASVPARVDYALTPLGHDLFPMMVAIKTWAETHMDRVFRARAQFDAR
ncbi:transcriptional regulator, HxlR family [Asanoa ishikariensis]|uniref:Transcriptional regulator, HxlR family n=1 Tax=Asanoa ishikariensis TaxID=137265 RepID=A0A1H3US88_9ACTN|nr:transcriptional regulator, HxlR family [Asanoa ishikariensis]